MGPRDSGEGCCDLLMNYCGFIVDRCAFCGWLLCIIVSCGVAWVESMCIEASYCVLLSLLG